MTETELEPIVVTGQRRSSPFVPFPGGSGSGGPGEPGDEQNEISDDPDQGGGVSPPPSDQCSDPEAKRTWNADAAAASAIAAFLAKAAQLGDTGLGQREFGFMLKLGAGNTVEPGNLT